MSRSNLAQTKTCQRGARDRVGWKVWNNHGSLPKNWAICAGLCPLVQALVVEKVRGHPASRDATMGDHQSGMGDFNGARETTIGLPVIHGDDDFASRQRWLGAVLARAKFQQIERRRFRKRFFGWQETRAAWQLDLSGEFVGFRHTQSPTCNSYANRLSLARVPAFLISKLNFVYLGPSDD